MSMNRIYNCKNPNQGDYKKALCVCSAGLLRSPTIALVLSQDPYNYNTRACGIDEGHALIKLDEVLLHWADEVVCADKWHMEDVKELLDKRNMNRPVICLALPDKYRYRDTQLIDLIKERYESAVQDKIKLDLYSVDVL